MFLGKPGIIRLVSRTELATSGDVSKHAVDADADVLTKLRKVLLYAERIDVRTTNGSDDSGAHVIHFLSDTVVECSQDEFKSCPEQFPEYVTC